VSPPETNKRRGGKSNKMKKIGLICLVLVLAVGALGVSYALWSDSLFLEGTVETGEVEVCIVSIASDDVGIDPGHNKDVGWVETQIVDCNTATITIHDGYPCYETYIHFTSAIGGTIPVILEEINITNPGDPCITVDAWDSLGEQRHPGERADNTIYVHVEQCADQGATYTFTVEFYYVQYNESIFPP
jgi:hypothetical protein